jgi:hypothetical protein
MAELICQGCRTTYPAGTAYCPICFSIPVPHTAEESAPVPAGGAGCDDPDCAHGGQPPAVGCRACGLKGTPAETTLRFPWGPVLVEAGGSLLIGRENSPIAGRLADYSNISRRHARVHSDGTSLTVEDLDSTNGTFLNDKQVPPRTPTPARAGDRLRFAATLEATVLGTTS